jgi:hypothetical protein
VEPLPGVTLSHEPVEVADAVNVKADSPVLVIAICASVAPAVSRIIELGCAFSAGVVVTINVTGSCTVGSPEEDTVTAPIYVPGDSPAGSATMLKSPGVKSLTLADGVELNVVVN